MKVVINACHGGGFRLSEAGVRAYAARKGWSVYVENPGMFATYWKVPEDERTGIHEGDRWPNLTVEEKQDSNARYDELTIPTGRDLDRTDPDLIAVIEALGTQAGSPLSKLKIVEIPDGVDWEIEEYGGNEWVAEKHRTWS